MHHVAFLLQASSLVSGLTIPAEMLRAADELHRVRARSKGRLRLTVTTTDNAASGWLPALAIAPQCRPEELERVSLLYVPPFWRRPAARMPGISPLLARLAAEGTLMCAISTGAYLVAEAGLLDGRAATTHWSFLDDFARRYPRVDLKRQHLITRAGNLYCAGSLNATADLTTYFIESLYGAEIARRVTAQFSPEIRRPALQQGFFDGESSAQPDELMAEAQRRLRDRAEHEVDLEGLCHDLRISRRSLNRRFRAATGGTPGQYVRRVRMRLASELLRGTDLSIAQVAARVGYEDAGHFATLYRRLTGRSPSGYRATVRAKLFTPD